MLKRFFRSSRRLFFTVWFRLSGERLILDSLFSDKCKESLRGEWSTTQHDSYRFLSLSFDWLKIFSFSSVLDQDLVHYVNRSMGNCSAWFASISLSFDRSKFSSLVSGLNLVPLDQSVNIQPLNMVRVHCSISSDRSEFSSSLVLDLDSCFELEDLAW